VCCCVLQCVGVCCSVLQCVAVCCRVLQSVAVCCSVLQCVAVCCSVLQCVAVCCSVLQYVYLRRSDDLRKVCGVEVRDNKHLRIDVIVTESATYCNTLQCNATHCNTLQHTTPESRTSLTMKICAQMIM